MLNIVCFVFVGDLAVESKKEKRFKNPCAGPYLDKTEWIRVVKSFEPHNLMDMRSHHFLGSNWRGEKVFEIAHLKSKSGIPLYVSKDVYESIKSIIRPFRPVF